MAKKLFSQVKIFDAMLISILIIIICIITYISTNYPLEIQRKSYPLQALFAKKTVRCSENSPNFMFHLMDYMINEQKSMTNQLVFRTTDGNMYHCESGWEDGFRGNKLLTENSRFRYASVSKIVTSAMILRLVNEGKISLEQKLLDIVDVPIPQDSRIEKITVRMLLEHSAGFDRFKTYTPMLTAGVKPWCPTNIVKLASVKLDFDPDTQFQYSNVGYCLLGAIVESVTKKSFREATEEVFKLKSKNIQFIDNDFLADEIQYDYRFEHYYGDFYRTQFDFKDSLSAVGGLSGSAKAMTELTYELLQEQPVNILSRSKTPCSINLLEGCYGYALLPYQPTGENFIMYGKSGFYPGVNTDVWVDSYGGILVAFRGASTPTYQVKTSLQDEVYHTVKSYYISQLN